MAVSYTHLEQLRKIAFFLLQLLDLFLDGPFHDQAVYLDIVVLTDPVRTVRRLVLRREVPPGIEMDDDIGSGQDVYKRQVYGKLDQARILRFFQIDAAQIQPAIRSGVEL